MKVSGGTVMKLAPRFSPRARPNPDRRWVPRGGGGPHASPARNRHALHEYRAAAAQERVIASFSAAVLRYLSF
ncbi:hypothetical protein AGIG_G22657 [Arapaima gigas]